MGTLLVIGCDNSSLTPASNTEEETSSELSERFFANTNSLNPLLDTAVDTLRQRNTQNGFVHEFITERGYPVWDAHSAFYKKGKPIFRVPVQDASGQKITGFIEIVMNESQPIYYWIARGTQLKDMSPDALETLMWGYEQRVFGKTHTDEGARIVRKIADDPKEGNVRQQNKVRVAEVCWSTCVGNYCGEWECEGGGDPGGGDIGGFGGGDRGGPRGGGGGSGSPDPGDDDRSGDDGCTNYKARIPVGGCENNEDDSGSAAAFMGTIGIDTQKLDKFPKLKCTVDRVLDTSKLPGIDYRRLGELRSYKKSRNR